MSRGREPFHYQFSGWFSLWVPWTGVLLVFRDKYFGACLLGARLKVEECAGFKLGAPQGEELGLRSLRIVVTVPGFMVRLCPNLSCPLGCGPSLLGSDSFWAFFRGNSFICGCSFGVSVEEK